MSAVWTERGVPPVLRPWVASTWTLAVGPGGAEHRVLPDGCIDLVWVGGGVEVAGASTAAFTVVMPGGGHAAGVRFHPGAAPALLGLPGAELRDLRPPAEAAFGRNGAELTARAGAGPDPRRTLVAWLASRSAEAPRPDPAVRAATGLLDRGARAAEVAAALGWSGRQLRRRVTADVGYGPKRLGRVLRLQRALALARDGEALAAVAAACGYADQAHLTRDCTALAGLPPAALLATD